MDIFRSENKNLPININLYIQINRLGNQNIGHKINKNFIEEKSKAD